MISQTAEYALRAVVYLTMNSGAPFTTEQIAKTTKVPPAYLSKILQSLTRAGLVQSQRGLRGGFILSRPAESISVLEVINAVDPVQRIRYCPLGIEEHGINLCPMHQRLDDALAMVEQVFAQSKLTELLAQPSSSVPMCSFPGKCQEERKKKE